MGSPVSLATDPTGLRIGALNRRLVQIFRDLLHFGHRSPAV